MGDGMKLDGISGARVIVTAGGSGIGAVIAGRFAAAGARVFVCDVDPACVEAQAGEHPEIGACVADVSSSADVDRLFAQAHAHLGGLDVLVNNAGIGGPVGCIEELDEEEWRRTLDVNLTGAFLCTRRAVPILKAQRSGSIVSMSSHYGFLGGPTRAPYVASKWALIGLTKTLAMELGPFGVRANAICPGGVEGERLERVMRLEAEEKGITCEQLHDEWVRGCSLRTFVSPDDVAAMILFLCSTHGARISGQAVAVDGHTEFI
jgi:NAD(P)-dependent dehydrogenase (short-subunit alcohol dehydrogenase family)